MSESKNRRRWGWMAVPLVLAMGPAHAITFEWGDSLNGTLNTMMTAGAGVRMQDRSHDLVGKGNLNPAACGGNAQSCQGVFRDQTHPAATLAAAPGQAFLNADDGNWNYEQYDLTQAVFKVTQDLSLTWGDYGFFGKWLYFYDFVNNEFTDFHPNLITAANRNRVGCDDTNCDNVTGFDRAYGPGEPTRRPRADGEVLRQVGTDLQLLDYYFYGSVGLPFSDEKQLTFKVGNQTINWGESTVLLINSLNQVNPINANNFTRVGFDLGELFVPTGMVFLSTEPFESTTIEAFYGYEWKPVEIWAPGSFFSFADLGTNNAIDYASISFGGPAEDPDICGTGAPPAGTDAAFDYYNPLSGCGSPTNNPLSGLTNTALTIRRVRDNEPKNTGQFGVSMKYFADWLNNGTEIGLYFMNYHSKLPFVSFYSTVASCARAEGNTQGMDATTGAELVSYCNDADTAAPTDLPVVSSTADGARAATRNAVPIDTVRYQVEYPENLQLYGMSFNTTVGDFSIQGEFAFRPDSPLQVDLQDLTFHALGPMLARCHDPASGCTGSSGGQSQVDGVTYQSSDFAPYPGVTAYPDTFDLAVGAGVGSARSFPSFIGAWRGIAPGETPPSSYIRGWEYFDVWQTNIGGTYIHGATDKLSLALGADQVIWLLEAGAQYVPDLPGTDQLQIEAPGTFYHASAGADGSATGNMAQDCAQTVDCHYSGIRPDGTTFGDPGVSGTYGDGLRFNPHQEDAAGYADKFSWGYAIVNLTRYESVLPGISLAPITIFQHDVNGTSTDAAAQFTKGRKDVIFIVETRYKEALSFNVGYVWIFGGGKYNLQADRDQALAYVKYQF